MLAAALGMLAAAVLMQKIDSGIHTQRYHQHLRQPSAQELGEPIRQAREDELMTHLPIVRIYTGGQTIPGKPAVDENGVHVGYETGDRGETEIVVSFSNVTRNGVWHYGADEPDETGTALFRIRGNSSRWFSKSSYRLKLISDPSSREPVKQSLLGMAAGEEWALHGPFLDKTLIRNYLCLNLAGEITDDWVPNVRFCELILDGEYRGVYLLTEMIDVQENRLELHKYNEGDLVTSYLLRIEPTINEDRLVENFSFLTYRMEPGRKVELLYPGVLHQNEQVRRYVQANFSEVERELYSDQSDEWLDDVDLDLFVDYYLIEEFFAINDTFSASTYFYRDARGRLCIGPVWDFNNALNNFFQPLPSDGLMLSQRGWFGRMMRNEEFVHRVIRRYRDLRGGVLSDENLQRYITETEAWLGDAVDRNFTVWGESFDSGNLTEREVRRPEEGSDASLESLNPDSHEEAVEWMVEYMLERAAWMDEHIESLLQYCHPSKSAAAYD